MLCYDKNYFIKETHKWSLKLWTIIRYVSDVLITRIEKWAYIYQLFLLGFPYYILCVFIFLYFFSKAIFVNQSVNFQSSTKQIMVKYEKNCIRLVCILYMYVTVCPRHGCDVPIVYQNLYRPQSQPSRILGKFKMYNVRRKYIIEMYNDWICKFDNKYL